MLVTIIGPNLRDQSKGSFHVHAAGCADIVKMSRRDPEFAHGWDMEASTREEVAGEVYADMIDESGATPESYVSDFHFAPCCASLS